MYVMLCGEPPFKGSTDTDILNKVKNGSLDFKKVIWTAISKEAQNLIRSMLNRNVKERKTIYQVLEDPWFSCIINEKCEQKVTHE